MVNKVILIGNVGADPEIRTLEGGTKVARIRLATTERIFNRQTQETKEHTEWHSVTLWRGLADVVDRFVRKGSQVYIEGSIRSREWEDQTGAKRYGMDIVANELKLLGKRSEGAPAGGYGGGSQGGYSGGASGGQGGHQAPSGGQGGGYQASAAPVPAPAAPAAPDIPANDPDDLPF
ncbi:MAG: single-stranded DNA-binding protein [Rikenellaceae bacterium]|jgi:single-strand DNA-binding protein|nr:single-stranded DNA-binding protein [Rikenellaceae bacterium]